MQIANIVSKVVVTEFQPKSGVKIETDPKATSMSNGTGADDADVIEALIQKLEVSVFPPAKRCASKSSSLNILTSS